MERLLFLSYLLRDEMWHGRPAHDYIFTRAGSPCHRGFIPKQTRACCSTASYCESSVVACSRDADPKA